MTNSIMRFMQEKYPLGLPGLEENIEEIYACIQNIENSHIRKNMEILLDLTVLDYLTLSGAKTLLQKEFGEDRATEMIVDSMIFNDPFISKLFPQLFEGK